MKFNLNPPSFPIVVVIWDDAKIDNTEIKRADAVYKHCLYSTVGFLLSDEPDGLVLSTDYHEDSDEVRSVMSIPRGMIKRIIYVRNKPKTS